MPEATVRILRILLQCGMIAREEQEIVRALIRDPAASGGSARAGRAAQDPRPDAARPRG